MMGGAEETLAPIAIFDPNWNQLCLHYADIIFSCSGPHLEVVFGAQLPTPHCEFRGQNGLSQLVSIM